VRPPDDLASKRERGYSPIVALDEGVSLEGTSYVLGGRSVFVTVLMAAICAAAALMAVLACTTSMGFSSMQTIQDLYAPAEAQPIQYQPAADSCVTDMWYVAFLSAFSAYHDALPTFDHWTDVGKTYYDLLQGQGWSLQKSVSVPSHYQSHRDRDYCGLWQKGDQCIINFRGSDSHLDFASAFRRGRTNCYGIAGIPKGMCENEFVPLALKMKSDQWWPYVKQTCAVLTVTGHSLGGGLAQLLAASLNKQGDPHGAGVTVDYLYTVGADSLAEVEITNDKTTDGCFAGKHLWAASQTPKRTLLGMGPSKNVTRVDWVYYYREGEFAKADKVLAFGPSSWVTATCGTDFPPIDFDKPSEELHDLPAYHTRIRRCVSIE